MPPFNGFKFKGLKGAASSGRGGPMRLSATTSAARGAALLQTKVTVTTGRPPASSRSLTSGATLQHHDHWRTDLFGRPLLRLPTFRQSSATALTAEPLTLEEPADAASPAPADDVPVSDVGAVESSPANLPVQTPRQSLEAEPAAVLASAATPPEASSAADDRPAQILRESTAAGAADRSQTAAEQETPAAAEHLQSVAVPAVHAARSSDGGSSSEPRPESPGTPAQAAEPRPPVQDSDGQPTAERLRDPVMARFLIPQKVSGFLIGSSGARMRSYCERSGAKVWVSGQQHEDARSMRTLFMTGGLEAVEEAAFMVFTDLISAEAPKENRNYFRTKDGRTKARMLVPAWLAGTVLGKGASHISAANARAGAFMRFAPSADDQERDRLLEIVAPEVGALGRAVTEVMKLFLRNQRYKAVFIAPGGVSTESLAARKRWHDRHSKGARRGGAARQGQRTVEGSAAALPSSTES